MAIKLSPEAQQIVNDALADEKPFEVLTLIFALQDALERAGFSPIDINKRTASAVFGGFCGGVTVAMNGTPLCPRGVCALILEKMAREFCTIFE